MENKCKTKHLEIILKSLSPAADVMKTKSLSMEVTDEKDCRIKDRLYLHIGECLYTIDNKGFIIERVIPHE